MHRLKMKNRKFYADGVEFATFHDALVSIWDKR